MPVFFALTLLAATPTIDGWLDGCGGAPASGFVRVMGPRAPADGWVSALDEHSVTLSHCFFENHEVRFAKTVITGLERVDVKRDQRIVAGQRVGEGRSAKSVTTGASAATHAHLFTPRTEGLLVVVDVDGHRAVLLERGAELHSWDVGHGQAEGIKEERGDLKTPRGLYFVVSRSTGPFAGDFAAYFGPAWVKVNYPNAFDAARGLDAGLITDAQARDITQQWSRRAATLQQTKLGGGIGFHGWNAPWDGADGGYALSWGCVVMHPEEVKGFYELVPVGTPVVLL